MQNASTQILTGHLKEYPLCDILGILRHQRKTGRLFVDYPAAPALFYFRDGELVDAQAGVLKGPRALMLAAGLPESPFNFNPLIEPSSESADSSLQEAMTRLIDGPEDEPSLKTEAVSEAPVTEIRAAREVATDVPLYVRRAPPQEGTPASPLPAFGKPDPKSRRRRVLIFAGVLLFSVAAPPILTFKYVFGGRPSPAPAAAERATPDGTAEEAPPPAVPESLTGDPGLRALTYGDAPTEGPVQTGQKVRQPSRAPAPKKTGAEGAALSGPPPPAPAGERPAESPGVNRAATTNDPTITVVTRVDNGRVVEAYVENRRPGMEAYEASALRAARQRHFAPGTTGSEKVRIKVDKH